MATPIAEASERSEHAEIPITGMTCASCANLIERRLKKAPGVEHASVNFATARATVEYDPEQTDICDLVERIRETGYGVGELPKAGAENWAAAKPEAVAQTEEYRDLRRRFIWALIFSVP